MAKQKAKYDIKYSKDVNGCTQGSVLMKLANGNSFQIHIAAAPDCKVRVAKGLINESFEERIPEFIQENPGAICVAWDDENLK